MKQLFYLITAFSLILLLFTLSIAQNSLSEPVVRELLSESFKKKRDLLKKISIELYKAKEDEQRARLLVKRSEILSSLGEFFLSRNDLETAIQLTEIPIAEKNKIRFLLASTYELTNRTVSAINLYDAILVDEPNNMDVLLLRTEKYLLSKEYELSKQLIDKALSLSPSNPQVKFLLSEYLFDIGNNVDSENILRELEVLSQNDPLSLQVKKLAIFRSSEHAIGRGDFTLATNLLLKIQNPSKLEVLRLNKLKKIINDIKILQSEFLSFQTTQYPKTFLAKAARFNENWIERSPKLYFTSTLVDIISYYSATKITLNNKEGGLNYYQVDEMKPLTIEIEGPTLLRLDTRPVHSAQNTNISLKLIIKENNITQQIFSIENNKPSSEVSFSDLENIYPGVKEPLELKVPSGKHRYEISSLLGSTFVRPIAASPSLDDFLLGNLSATQWWGKLYYQCLKENNFASIDEIESRYRITNNFEQLVNSINQVSTDLLGYYGWLLMATSKHKLGKPSALDLAKASNMAEDIYLAKQTLIEAINKFLDEKDEDNAIKLAKTWLDQHSKDDEIREILIRIWFNSSNVYFLEAWFEAEKFSDPQLKNKIALMAARRINWERRLAVSSAAGIQPVDQNRFETTTQFRTVRESMLDPIFSEGSTHIISESLSAKLEATTNQPLSLRAKIYAQAFDINEYQPANNPTNIVLESSSQIDKQISSIEKPTRLLPLEVTLHSTKIMTFVVKEKEVNEIVLPILSAGSNQLTISFPSNFNIIQQPNSATTNIIDTNLTPINITPKPAWYAYVQLERADTKTLLKPNLRYNYFVATATKNLEFNAFASSLVRITLRTILEDNNLNTNQAQIIITNNKSGKTTSYKVNLPRQYTEFSSLVVDKTAKLSDKCELAILLPSDGDIYKIEIKPLSEILIASIYDGSNSAEKSIINEQPLENTGFILDSIARYQKLPLVSSLELDQLIVYEINNSKNNQAEKGLFSFYTNIDRETSLLLEEGVKNRTGNYYLETGIINRKNIDDKIFLRNLIGQRTLFSAKPVLHLESEVSRYFDNKKLIEDNKVINNRVRLNGQLRSFVQNTNQGLEASLKLDVTASKRFNYPNQYLTITPLIGYYRVWQSLDRVSRKEREEISSEVFSPFFRNNPQGLILQTTISYFPFTDTFFSTSFRLTSKRNLNPIDVGRFRYQVRAAKISLSGKLETQAIFSQTYNFNSNNSTSVINNFFIKSEYGLWRFDNKRLILESGIRFVSDLKTPTITFGIRVDINRGNKFSQYDPSEIIFEEQKLREYKEKLITRKLK